MIKTLMLATPNPKHTREECQDYLGHKHPRHAMSVESLSDTFKLYSMNFVQTVDEAKMPMTLCKRNESFMMCVEICCESREAYEEELTDEEYLNIVRPDEGYMIAEFQGSAPVFYEVEEKVLFCRDEPRKSGEYRIFDFVKKQEGVAEDLFDKEVGSTFEKLADDLLFRAVSNGLVVNHVVDAPTLFGLPGGSETVVIETRTTSLEALDQYFERIQRPRLTLADAEKSFSLVTRMEVIH